MANPARVELLKDSNTGQWMYSHVDRRSKGSQFQLSQQGVTLKVLEAYTRDVGRGVVRIDYDAMDSLDASTGDIVEIKGKRRTVGKCLPLYPSDEGRGVIRIDLKSRTI